MARLIKISKWLLPVIVCFLIAPALALSGPVQAQKEVDVLLQGAKGDGIFLNTKVLQKAIDDLSARGGGKLVFPEGVYHTGSLSLKSGVTLHLEHGSVILGSISIYDYLDGKALRHLIDAENARNIGITGEGIINGRGRLLALAVDSLYHEGILTEYGYNVRRKRPELRPKLVEFRLCDQIIFEGVTFRNSCNWVIHLDRSRNIAIDHVTVDSDDYWNNDGIDISDCTNVKLTNSFINAADDGICLKSHHTGYLNDSIYIARCTVRSSASAVKLGTASWGGFRNVKIEDIFVYDTFRSAIALESVDGGILENIDISNIKANNTGNAIFIKLGHRNVGGKVGSLKNISIRDVVVQVPFGAPDLKYDIRGPELPFFHNVFPASITGIPGHYVENVRLENIRIEYPGRANNGYAHIPLHRLDSVPENAAEYPEFHMFGELPSWAFYVRHVKGLSMKNIQLKVWEEDFRPAFVFDDVDGLTLDKIDVIPTNKESQIILKEVRNPSISKVRIEGMQGDGVRRVGK